MFGNGGGDSLILAQREIHYPITKAIYVLFERLGDGPGIAAAMGTWAMLLLALGVPNDPEELEGSGDEDDE